MKYHREFAARSAVRAPNVRNPGEVRGAWNLLQNHMEAIEFGYRCRCATTGNHGLSGTSAVDGVSIAAADLVLCWQQTTATENGVYKVAAGDWTRLKKFDALDYGRMINTSEGTEYAGSLFICTGLDTIVQANAGITELNCGGTSPTNVTDDTNTGNLSQVWEIIDSTVCIKDSAYLGDGSGHKAAINDAITVEDIGAGVYKPCIDLDNVYLKSGSVYKQLSDVLSIVSDNLGIKESAHINDGTSKSQALSNIIGYQSTVNLGVALTGKMNSGSNVGTFSDLVEIASSKLGITSAGRYNGVALNTLLTITGSNVAIVSGGYYDTRPLTDLLQIVGSVLGIKLTSQIGGEPFTDVLEDTGSVLGVKIAALLGGQPFTDVLRVEGTDLCIDTAALFSNGTNHKAFAFKYDSGDEKWRGAEPYAGD